MTDITENLSDEDKADYDRIAKRQWLKCLEKQDNVSKRYTSLINSLVIEFKKDVLEEWEQYLKDKDAD